jgi:hypothetical protein
MRGLVITPNNWWSRFSWASGTSIKRSIASGIGRRHPAMKSRRNDLQFLPSIRMKTAIDLNRRTIGIFEMLFYYYREAA